MPLSIHLGPEPVLNLHPLRNQVHQLLPFARMRCGNGGKQLDLVGNERGITDRHHASIHHRQVSVERRSRQDDALICFGGGHGTFLP